jgi:hypothetical protein
LSSLPGGIPIFESATVEPIVENAAKELDWRGLEDLVCNNVIESVVVDNPIDNLSNSIGDIMLDNIVPEIVKHGFIVDTGEKRENV